MDYYNLKSHKIQETKEKKNKIRVYSIKWCGCKDFNMKNLILFSRLCS